MKLFDAHCHLADFPNIGKMIDRAAEAGVVGMNVCGTNSNDWKRVLETVPNSGKEHCALTQSVGIHPGFVGGRDIHERYSSCASLPPAAARPAVEPYLEDFQTLEKTVRDFPMLGIGETGLDFSDRFQNRAEQEASFAAHLDLARELGRPVTVHCVKAWGRLIEILKEHPAPKVILHAYSGSPELIAELEKLNCWFSFGPAVLNPRHKRGRASAATVPDELLLIETDSTGEPERLVAVARAVAELRGAAVEEIAETTFVNARFVFGPSG